MHQSGIRIKNSKCTASFTVAGVNVLFSVTVTMLFVDAAKFADACNAMIVVDAGGPADGRNAAQYAVPSAVRANDTVNDTACPTVVSCTHTFDSCPASPQPVTSSPLNQSYGTTSGGGANGARLADSTRNMLSEALGFAQPYVVFAPYGWMTDCATVAVHVELEMHGFTADVPTAMDEASAPVHLRMLHTYVDFEVDGQRTVAVVLLRTNATSPLATGALAQSNRVVVLDVYS